MNQNNFNTVTLCDALGEPRSSWYRWSNPLPHTELQPKRTSHRKLSAEDERHVLDILNSERFCDMAPGEIYATLLDEGVYLCSERTMYRILERNSQTGITCDKT